MLDIRLKTKDKRVKTPFDKLRVKENKSSFAKAAPPLELYATRSAADEGLRLKIKGIITHSGSVEGRPEVTYI